jgi:hypothetical protein
LLLLTGFRGVLAAPPWEAVALLLPLKELENAPDVAVKPYAVPFLIRTPPRPHKCLRVYK